MVVCHRMCDYHHDHPEEEERPTTMVTTTGVLAQGAGCHYDAMTGSTAMVTTMQDRLQERSLDKRTTISSDYIIRLTDRLRSLRSKCMSFFSHGSRAGTTTRRDMTTRVAAAAACNGTDYNNCDVSTTATSTTGSDTESTSSADTDLQSTPTPIAINDSVDLINPPSDDCTHYILMLAAGAKAKAPPPPGPKAPPPGPPAAAAAPPLPVMLPQGHLPQPTGLMVLHHPSRSGYKRPATS